MGIQIQFWGAAQTVTGSCYLVQTDNVRFLVDAGMFQGPGVEQLNLESFGFSASSIDFVLLTHTHIDHSGLLPKLVKEGFTGPIYCTLHTIPLATILLLDSAKIQESNYREGLPWKHTSQVGMAYTMKDAERTITMFHKIAEDEAFTPADGVDVTFRHVGHVLGAGSIEIKIEDKTIVFSGDIGRHDHELLGGYDADYRLPADYIIMEALYGGEHHPTRAESVAELMGIIADTVNAGGSVYIQCFAAQRTQELLHDIKFAKQAGVLSNNLPVWLDSPMAQKVTEVYSHALDHGPDSLFDFPGLAYVRNYRQSQKISRRGGQVIIAGSGMADGGRIVEHLAGCLPNPRNTVCFVGYQAEATLGRELVEGATEVAIFDRMIKVNAQIHHLKGFSAHGDTSDYQRWFTRYASSHLKRLFLVHAEPERAQRLMLQLQAADLVHDAQIPARGEKYDL